MQLYSFLSRFKKKRAQVVLMYHRIASPGVDPWELSVSPENFEEHLRVLKGYDVISVKALSDILKNNTKNAGSSVAVTFDDGYRDNYLVANPLLQKYNIPATFFITSNTLGHAREFWWDALERICLQTKQLPSRLTLEQLYKSSWDIGKEHHKNGTSSLDLYFELCGLIRKIPATQQKIIIKILEDWANNTDDRPEYLTMDKDELLDLQSNSLFTVGAHTMTHPFLPEFSYTYQETEILGGIAFLETLTGKSINYLAYPHGGRDKKTLDIIANSSIELAFTTDPQQVKKDTPHFAVPRFQVGNWDGKTFENNLVNWMSNSYLK